MERQSQIYDFDYKKMIFGFASTKNEVYIWLSTVFLKFCLYFASTFPLLSLYRASTKSLLIAQILLHYALLFARFVQLCGLITGDWWFGYD